MNKFICETCNYKTDYESKYKQHLETKKHKNNGILVRKEENIIKECDKCSFTSKNNDIFRTHYLTKHSNKEEKEKEFTYYCKFCNFGTFNKSLMDIHKNSKKHINITLLLNEKVGI